MLRALADRYRSLPAAWWVIAIYILVTKAVDIFAIYRSLILVDFQNRSPGEISLLLMVFGLGTGLCNLYLGAVIDRSKDPLRWLTFPRLLTGGLIASLAFQQSLPFLVVTLFVLAVTLYVGNIAVYKVIKLIAPAGEQKESMLVLFSTFRHLGLLICTGIAFLWFKGLGNSLMLFCGLATIFATLGLFWALPIFGYSPIAPRPAGTPPVRIGLVKVIAGHWRFFAAILLVGLIYETTLGAVVPLMFKYEGVSNYVERFSILEAFSKGIFLFLPLVFAFLKDHSFKRKLVVFLLGHMAAAFLYFLFKLEHGWMLAIPIYATVCLWGEALLTVLLSDAAEYFPTDVFGRIAGYFEFFVFLGVALSGLLTETYLNVPELLYGAYLTIPILVYLLVMSWRRGRFVEPAEGSLDNAK